MGLRQILADIHALEEDLLAFERKYGIRSETFYAAYISGEEPEDDNWVLDFGEWASVYRTWLARQQALEVAVAWVECVAGISEFDESAQKSLTGVYNGIDNLDSVSTGPRCCGETSPGRPGDAG
jgi:hypothetical protein